MWYAFKWAFRLRAHLMLTKCIFITNSYGEIILKCDHGSETYINNVLLRLIVSFVKFIHNMSFDSINLDKIVSTKIPRPQDVRIYRCLRCHNSDNNITFASIKSIMNSGDFGQRIIENKTSRQCHNHRSQPTHCRIADARPHIEWTRRKTISK